MLPVPESAGELALDSSRLGDADADSAADGGAAAADVMTDAEVREHQRHLQEEERLRQEVRRKEEQLRTLTIGPQVRFRRGTASCVTHAALKHRRGRACRCKPRVALAGDRSQATPRTAHGTAESHQAGAHQAAEGAGSRRGAVACAEPRRTGTSACQLR